MGRSMQGIRQSFQENHRRQWTRCGYQSEKSDRQVCLLIRQLLVRLKWARKRTVKVDESGRTCFWKLPIPFCGSGRRKVVFRRESFEIDATSIRRENGGNDHSPRILD